MPDKMTRKQIVAALRALESECAKRGIAGEICIYGGAEMVLVFDARISTRDVDAVFRPKSEIIAVAHVVAEDLGIPADWLNDGVKGFLSDREEFTSESVADLEGLSNLRIVWPTADYLLAMKCIAARTEELASDRNDVEFLIRSLGLTSEEQVFERVQRFYPVERIPIKTRYFVGEILASLASLPETGESRKS